MSRVLIAGGGTGGHVFPMIAVGHAIGALDRDGSVVYVGTSRGLEAELVPKHGGTLELMQVEPLRGGGWRGALRGVAVAAQAVVAARDVLTRRRPDVVLSVGGYAAGPVALAARISGTPVAVLEPNSVLGLANRLLAPFSARAYTAFPEVERFFRPSVVLRTGVPLRAAFERAPTPVPGAESRILVLGGSQGALALNETVPRALAGMLGTGRRLRVVHQCGANHIDKTRSLYAELGLADRVQVTPFVSNMAEQLAWADLIVSRAGASTLAEICAVGRASVLVPYPFAASDHQARNAASLAQAGAAVLVQQSDATAERLRREISRLLASPDVLAEMSIKAAERGHPHAAESIARDLLALAAGRQGEVVARVTRTDSPPSSGHATRVVSEAYRFASGEA